MAVVFAGMSAITVLAESPQRDNIGWWYQNPDGTVLVGSKWEPGINPYSIGPDSDVLKAFGRYGWG